MSEPHAIIIDHVEGDRFSVHLRGHEIVVDQPVQDGGGDAGPAPTELFVASLAACVGHYAHRYLVRHGLPEEGLRVRARHTMSLDRPARIASIDVRLDVPPGVPDERLPALHAVASACTLHNTLGRPPRIDIRLAVPDGVGGVS